MAEVEPLMKKRRVEDEEGQTPDYTEREVGTLIKHLDPHRLVQIISNIALANPTVLEEMRDALRSETDPSKCKIFVRALHWDTTSEKLSETFAEFGNITEAVVLESGGKSRGYGFITFSNAYEAVKALEEPRKFIDGRETISNLASKRKTGNSSSSYPDSAGRSSATRHSNGGDEYSASESSKGGYSAYSSMTSLDQTRIFVRSLNFETTSERLEQVFSQWGEVVDAAVIFDRMTNKSKGYGFVTYKEPEAAALALREKKKEIDGRTVFCNLASERKRGVPSAQPPVSQTSMQYVSSPMTVAQQQQNAAAVAAATWPQYGQQWATTSFPPGTAATGVQPQYYMALQPGAAQAQAQAQAQAAQIAAFTQMQAQAQSQAAQVQAAQAAQIPGVGGMSGMGQIGGMGQSVGSMGQPVGQSVQMPPGSVGMQSVAGVQAPPQMTQQQATQSVASTARY